AQRSPLAPREVARTDHRDANKVCTIGPRKLLRAIETEAKLSLHLAERDDYITPGGFVTANIRVGIGHDTHRLAAGGPLRLGGVDVPHDKHAVGHSDADVLLHAITDALLGAAALGDIGELFP